MFYTEEKLQVESKRFDIKCIRSHFGGGFCCVNAIDEDFAFKHMRYCLGHDIDETSVRINIPKAALDERVHSLIQLLRTYPHRIQVSRHLAEGFGGSADPGWTAPSFSPPSPHVAFRRVVRTVERDNPEGDILVVSDNLASHKSVPVQVWLAAHPRVRHVFIPKGACWLNLIEPWWRLLRREAFAGMTFADAAEVERAVKDATRRLNGRARPWVWGRSARTPRFRRHAALYPY